LIPSFPNSESAADVELLLFPYVENEGLERRFDSLVEVFIPVRELIEFEYWCEELLGGRGTGRFSGAGEDDPRGVTVSVDISASGIDSGLCASACAWTPGAAWREEWTGSERVCEVGLASERVGFN